MGTDYADYFWGRAGRESRVKALLGCFTRRREDTKVGGRVSPRAAFRYAEGWEGRASLVRGQADACPSLCLASPMASVGGQRLGGAQRRETLWPSWPLCEIELGLRASPALDNRAINIGSFLTALPLLLYCYPHAMGHALCTTHARTVLR